MAKTDVKTVAAKNTAPVAPKEENVPVAGGKITVHFLADDAIPERKALGRAEGGGQWQEVAQALATKPGRVAVVYTGTDPKEVNARRTALIQAAARLKIEMNLAKTAVRDSGNKDAEGKIVHALYACVATPEVVKAQAKARAEKEAAMTALAKEKGMTLEQYKASLPRRGRAKKVDAAANGAAKPDESDEAEESDEE